MASVFSDSTIFKHLDVFIHVPIDPPSQTYSQRGNPIIPTVETILTFKIKQTENNPNIKNGYDSSRSVEIYNANLVATNGNLSLTILPPNILGIVGRGVLCGSNVKVVISGVSQSSVYPIVGGILGDRARLEITYNSYDV